MSELGKVGVFEFGSSRLGELQGLCEVYPESEVDRLLDCFGELRPRLDQRFFLGENGFQLGHEHGLEWVFRQCGVAFFAILILKRRGRCYFLYGYSNQHCCLIIPPGDHRHSRQRQTLDAA